MTLRSRIPMLSALLVAGLAVAACGTGADMPDEAGAAAEMSAEELGRLGAEIEQAPDRAAEILEEEGLTWEEFEAAVRAVSADAEKARRYAEAFTEAGGQGTPPGSPAQAG